MLLVLAAVLRQDITVLIGAIDRAPSSDGSGHSSRSHRWHLHSPEEKRKKMKTKKPSPSFWWVRVPPSDLAERFAFRSTTPNDNACLSSSRQIVQHPCVSSLMVVDWTVEEAEIQPIGVGEARLTRQGRNEWLSVSTVVCHAYTCSRFSLNRLLLEDALNGAIMKWSIIS